MHTGEGVIQTTDGTTLRARGLADAALGELVRLDGGGLAQVVALERASVVAALLAGAVRAGERAQRTGQGPRGLVGEALLARAVDPLGNPLDGGAPPEAPSQPLLRRWPKVDAPPPRAVLTGVKRIDALDPMLAGGFRPLLGRAGSGKTSLALDMILGRARVGGRCVLVSIGASASEAASLRARLIEHGAASHTALVAATAAAPRASWLLAPLAGGALAQALAEPGGDVLLVLDGMERWAQALAERQAALGRLPSPRGAPLGMGQALADALGSCGTQGKGSVTIVATAQTGQAMGHEVAWELLLAGVRPYRLDPVMQRRGQRSALVGPTYPGMFAPGLPKALSRVSRPARLTLMRLEELRFLRVPETDPDRASGERLSALLDQSAAAPVSAQELTVLLFAWMRGFFVDVTTERIPEREAALLGWLRAGSWCAALPLTQPIDEATLLKRLGEFFR